MTKLCQVLHGEVWVPARRFWGSPPPESSLGKVMLESKGGWKVFLYIGTGIEKYVFNPQHIRIEDEV